MIENEKDINVCLNTNSQTFIIYGINKKSVKESNNICQQIVNIEIFLDVCENI